MWLYGGLPVDVVLLAGFYARDGLGCCETKFAEFLCVSVFERMVPMLLYGGLAVGLLPISAFVLESVWILPSPRSASLVQHSNLDIRQFTWCRNS